MKIEDAYVNARVVYTPNHGDPELGVVTSIGTHYVFVNYESMERSTTSRATDPAQLTLLDEWDRNTRWREILDDVPDRPLPRSRFRGTDWKA